ncbi:MAG: hypothetical protein F7B60_00670 [Desulfurococcales archaeon]|nr:hypothetical protein [Desulfurococcales archaeon]
MRESSREYSVTGKCVILDTTALLAGIQNIIPPPLYTTSKAVEEVKDAENREKLNIAIETGRINVKDPAENKIRETCNLAVKYKVWDKLSDTDISIAALALELKNNCTPIVFTDDYTIQYLLVETGVQFKPLRTKGIKTKQQSK